MVKLADTQDLGSCTIVCRFKSCHPHQTRIKRTREKILSSFYFIQEIISDLKSNDKYYFNVQPSVSNTRFFYAVLPSDLSPFVCGCSTVKSESQRQKFFTENFEIADYNVKLFAGSLTSVITTLTHIVIATFPSATPVFAEGRSKSEVKYNERSKQRHFG